MIDWLDRLLLNVPRHTMDQLAMALAAGAVIFLVVLFANVAWSIDRLPDANDEWDE